MDPKTPAKSRRTSADAPAEKVEAPARSSHVIDLRQQKEQPTSAAATPVAAPKKQSSPKKPARSVQRPKQPAEPTVAPDDFFDGDVLSSPDNKRRFWPAFGRFLALLVILCLVIAGGVYLYITYLQS